MSKNLLFRVSASFLELTCTCYLIIIMINIHTYYVHENLCLFLTHLDTSFWFKDQFNTTLKNLSSEEFEHHCINALSIKFMVVVLILGFWMFKYLLQFNGSIVACLLI